MADAKAPGLRVIPWTVNERADMERLIDLGVDGLISDYPDRLRAVLADNGYSAAAAGQSTMRRSADQTAD